MILRRRLNRTLRILLWLLTESALRGNLSRLSDRAGSQPFPFFFDSFAGANDSLFSCIRFILLVYDLRLPFFFLPAPGLQSQKPDGFKSLFPDSVFQRVIGNLIIQYNRCRFLFQIHFRI